MRIAILAAVVAITALPVFAQTPAPKPAPTAPTPPPSPPDPNTKITLTLAELGAIIQANVAQFQAKCAGVMAQPALDKLSAQVAKH